MSSAALPPRAPPIQYDAPLGTRWEKEKAAAGGSHAFDLPSDPTHIGPWIIGECVGKGASGRVKIAKHKVTGQFAAVKILPLAPLMNSRASLATQRAKSEKQRLGIDREITMMKLMNHPNILRIYDVYEGKRELFLVLEYVQGGELFDFLVNRGRLHAHEALTFFRQIVNGLNYAHTFSIIHRDLKPENILIASLSPPIIKIADWGMAAFAPPSLQLETSCGSPHYASPEIVNGERYQGTATDVWSCGVILFALLTGRLPFDDKNVKTLLNKVKCGKFDMPAWIDPLAQDLLTRMLVVDVSRRISVQEVLSHPWMSVSTAASRCMIVDNSPSPPSTSILARPIPDPSLIDKELFASLVIIWGRHASENGENIKRDLCSPVGHGEHAKAFYFLLGQYREETQKNSDSSETAASALPLPSDTLSNMSFNLGWELDTKIGLDIHKKYDISKGSAGLPDRPMTGRSQSALQTPHSPQPSAPPMRRAVTIARERPASPGGPRQPAVFDRAGGNRTSFQGQNANLPKSSLGMTPIIARPTPRRGYTYSHMSMTNNDTAVPMVPSDPVIPSRRASRRHSRHPSPQVDLLAVATQPSVHASPISSPTTSYSAQTDPVASPALLPAFSPVAKTTPETADDLLARFSALGVLEQGDRTTSRPVSSLPGKENKTVGEEYVQRADSLDAPRDVGRNVANIPSPASSSGTVQKVTKERKNRPPPLEFPALNRKRSTFSLLNSPGTPAPPSISAQNSRMLASPVVGEFKGWFSNLFGWKQQGQTLSTPWVLYSIEDGTKTRFELSRILARLGVATEMGVECMMRCRVDEPSGELANLKAVRFRIWLSPVASTTNSPQQLDSPLMTPTFLAAPPLTRGRASTLVAKSPYTSPLPSPTFHLPAPSGYSTAIALVQDKGSATTFRAIWRKLREVYVDAGTSSGGECFSPPIVSTPTVDTSRFAV